jgi:hypothetical protein
VDAMVRRGLDEVHEVVGVGYRPTGEIGQRWEREIACGELVGPP